MSREYYHIFKEGNIGTLTLKNRLVRSATCEYKVPEDGKITETVINIYRNLAKGGVGMIITGLMAISKDAKGVDGQVVIYDDSYIKEIVKISDSVHFIDPNCRIIAQLCHPGRQITHENTTADCVGPSEMESPLLSRKARELSIEEIEKIICDFVNAIERVKKAGYDGVQLHSAHGYLLSSFLSPYTNQRDDLYGGNIKNRVRIIKEIVSRTREKVGEFPILIKMNCDDHVEHGINKESFSLLASEIAASGVDAIEVSGAMWDCLIRSEEELGFCPVPLPESRTRINTIEKQSYYYNYIKELELSIPVILVGGHRNIEHMESIIQDGKASFLSLCRPLIAEPDLPNRWLSGIGSERANCVSCNACILFKDEFGCAFRRKQLNLPDFEKGFEKGWRLSFR